MAIIKCPECNHDVSDHAVSCPNCGYPIAANMGNSNEKGNEVQKKQNSRVGVTISAVAVAIIALGAVGAWWIFLRGGSDAEEKHFYEKIMRFERENNTDSLEVVMNEYLDMYNSDAHHYSEVKNIGNRFFVERDEWNSSVRQNSIEATHRFLDQYPDGYFRTKATNRLDSLTFVIATEQNTKEAYEEYLSVYDDGRYIDVARHRIDSIEAEEKRMVQERMRADSIAAAKRDSAVVDYEFF